MPDDDEIEQGYIDDNATIYMKQSVLEPYVQSGAGIQNVMYYGKKDQLESTLHFYIQTIRMMLYCQVMMYFVY